MVEGREFVCLRQGIDMRTFIAVVAVAVAVAVAMLAGCASSHVDVPQPHET